MYYPVMLNLKDRKVLFIGGGVETEVKVIGLLEAGARVTLVSPYEHPRLEVLAANGLIQWLKRSYRPGDLEGFDLCIAHPRDRSLNAEVAREARERRVWINAVDDPEHCDFILPAVHRQGDLIIAVSTSGVAPALGVRIKERLVQEYGPVYARYLALLRRLRPLVRQAYPYDFEARRAAWYRMVDSPALDLLARGEEEVAEKVLMEALASGIPGHAPAHLEEVAS